MNGFFLVAGLLMILLSVAHALWGEKKVFTLLTGDKVDNETWVNVYVPWHQITYVLGASGVGLLLAAFVENLAALPLFILAIVAGNFAVFILVCVLKKQAQLFSKSIPQTVLFVLLMILIALGVLTA